MTIIPNKSICKNKHLSNDKEYEVIEINDDMPYMPDLYFKIINDIGQKVWVDDWDCIEKPRIDRQKCLDFKEE